MIKYLITINIITFIIFGLDKYLAIKEKRRISERTLLTLSLLGGCYLELIAMELFRHKTKKLIFYIVNLTLIVFYTILLYKFKVI
jgi:uncharacterized membrane protein YsdA (DUF1294 family)